MSISERARRLFDFESRREEKIQALRELTEEVMPEFQRLVDFNASNRKGFDAKRLRQCLEEGKVMVAVVDDSRRRMFSIVSDNGNSVDQSIYLTFVINGRRFLDADFNKRSDEFTHPLRQFSALSVSKKTEAFAKFPEFYRPSQSVNALRTIGINPKRAHITQYG